MDTWILDADEIKFRKCFKTSLLPYKSKLKPEHFLVTYKIQWNLWIFTIYGIGQLFTFKLNIFFTDKVTDTNQGLCEDCPAGKQCVNPT